MPILLQNAIVLCSKDLAAQHGNDSLSKAFKEVISDGCLPVPCTCSGELIAWQRHDVILIACC